MLSRYRVEKNFQSCANVTPFRFFTGFDLEYKGFYLFLQLFDLALTLLAYRMGFSEINPFVREWLSSPWQLILLKGGVPLLIVWLVPGRWLLPAIGLLAVVIAWNLKELALLAL